MQHRVPVADSATAIVHGFNLNAVKQCPVPYLATAAGGRPITNIPDNKYHRSLKGSIYPTGTRSHIPDFSLISGSSGDKVSTRSRGPAARVTCHGNQDSPLT
jgi:hypothetical protein